MAGRYRIGQPRYKHTFILELNDPAQKHVHEQIDKMIDYGQFQPWIRKLLVEALPMPALPKSNGHLEEHYADPEDSA